MAELHYFALKRLEAGIISHVEATSMIGLIEGLLHLLEAKHRKQTAADFASWIVASIDEGW